MLNVKKCIPGLLTVVGVVGMIATVVQAVIDTGKADTILAVAEERKKEVTENQEATLSKKEAATCFAKAYWKTATLGVITTACFIASHFVHGKREAILASALGVSEMALHRFKFATVETVGDEVFDKIENVVAERQLKESKKDMRTEQDRNRNIVETGHGHYLFYDPYIDRHFRCSQEYIEKVVNELNAEGITGEFISLNDFYYRLGLNECKKGEEVGWMPSDGGELVEMRYSACVAEWGEPCIVLGFEVEPEYYYPQYR